MTGVYSQWGLYVPTDILVAIAQSPFRHAVYNLQPIYGFMRFLHIMGTVGFVALLCLFAARPLGLLPGFSVEPVRNRLVGALNWSFWITIGTGVVLFLYDPIQIGSHTMFLPKVVLTVAGYAISLVQRGRGLSFPSRRALAASAVVVWVAVVGCSTWNRVERPWVPVRGLDGIERFKG